MSRYVDLTGKKYGLWSVIGYSHSTGLGVAHWDCVCACGINRKVKSGSLTQGKSTSCGCVRKANVTKHGMFGTKTYAAWQAMNDRCTNKNTRSYVDYGGRGIKVCQEWADSFEQFLADVGEIPKDMQLDRIDNNGDYEPANVRLVTPSTNGMNRRNSCWWKVNGVVYESAVIAAESLNWSVRKVHTHCKGYFHPRSGNWIPPKDGCSYELKYKEAT